MFSPEQLGVLANIAVRDLPFEISRDLADRGVTFNLRDDVRPGYAHVLRAGDQYVFDINGAGETTWPVPVRGVDTDIGSWNGKSWAMLTGCGAILGQDNLVGCCDWLRPIRIHRCPFDWIAGGATAIVILDEIKACHALKGFQHFEADDEAHCRYLKWLLSPPHREIHLTYQIRIDHEPDRV